jgi:hypothetical protein
MTIVEVSSFDAVDDDEKTEFTYAELSDTAKARARETTGWDEFHRDRCVDDMKQDAENILGSLDSWSLTYSIGFCQGDGVGIKGYIDAIDIPDPEWVANVLPLLGRHKIHAKAGKHDVSWPYPIKAMRIEFSEPGHGDCPQLAEHEMELTLVPLNNDAADPDEYEYVDDIVVNKYCKDEAPEIWEAVTSYFISLCRRLYDDVTNWMLDDDEDGMLADCQERELVFDEDGYEI